LKPIVGAGAPPPEVFIAPNSSERGAFPGVGQGAARGFCIEGVVVAVVAARSGGANGDAQSDMQGDMQSAMQDGVIVWIAPRAEVFGRQERVADSCAPTRGEEIIAWLVRWAVDLGAGAGVLAGVAAAAAAGLRDMFPAFEAISTSKRRRASTSQDTANDGQGSLFAPQGAIAATDAADGDRPDDGLSVASAAIADVVAAQRAALTRRVMRDGLAVFFPGMPSVAAPHPGDGVIADVAAPEVMEEVSGAALRASAFLYVDPGYEPDADSDSVRGLACSGSDGLDETSSGASVGVRSFCRVAPVATRFVFLARGADGEAG